MAGHVVTGHRHPLQQAVRRLAGLDDLHEGVRRRRQVEPVALPGDLYLAFLGSGGLPLDTELPAEFVAFGSDRFLGIHYLVWVPAILLAVLSFVMHATPYGRRVYATGGNREAAYLSGVPVERVIASTYVWCGALAGVAGVMLAARLQSGQPTAGEFYELTAIAAVVLGGAALHGGEGTLYKSIIGVFIMVVLGNSLNLLNVDSYWQRVAIGAVIIAAAAADRLRSRR